MKYLGSILGFTKERNNDIMRVYRKKIAEASFVFLPAISELVANSPAERFYISPERAAAVVTSMDSGKPLPRMRSNKAELYGELYRRFVERKKLYPDKPAKTIMASIVVEPAPKFYLTPRSLQEIYFKIKNGWYEKQHDKIQDIDAARRERKA